MQIDRNVDTRLNPLENLSDELVSESLRFCGTSDEPGRFTGGDSASDEPASGPRGFTGGGSTSDEPGGLTGGDSASGESASGPGKSTGSYSVPPQRTSSRIPEISREATVFLIQSSPPIPVSVVSSGCSGAVRARGFFYTRTHNKF